MTRVAFITDQHICSATRWEETLRVMNWCAARLEQERPEVIALGGDLFDRKPDVNELRVTAEWLIRLADIAPVVAVSGNHDPYGLTIFNFLSSTHPIHFTDVPEVWCAGGVEFALLPWPRKTHLLAMLGDVSVEAARQVGVELLLNVLRGLGESSSTCPRCFVGHVQLCGAKVSTGQPLAPGADFEIGLEDLALSQCDAYLLGHIHLPDDMAVGGAPVSYGGSFRRTAYGEVEEKSIVVLDFVSPGNVTRRRIPIPCTPMFLVSAHWYGDHVGLPGDVVVPGGLAFEGEEPSLTALMGAEVRLRYQVDTDQRDAAKAAADAWKHAVLKAGALACKVEETVRSVNTARAPEVAKALTLADKLTAYWAARGTTPDEARARSLLTMAHELEGMAS